ncbi:hypothetical protein SY86_16725 [Erwinia tracheiphila]|uniref:Uncharacterized protein n=1 Tax=Erwinia tracheiphila TaxID=65700 RepID=A0A0M2KBH0_9GAMM|nr:hypothetical protein ETR_14086 [Erwinia tracheiphila PSU-1]KKF36705.1 hypothetical protein SY86_16725 [Erwinia tracheiphila]
MCRGLLENGELLSLPRELAFKAGDLGRLFALAFRSRCLILLFAAPVVEPGFIQAELAGSSSDTDAFSQHQCFITKFGQVLFACFLIGCC